MLLAKKLMLECHKLNGYVVELKRDGEHHFNWRGVITNQNSWNNLLLQITSSD